MEKLTQKRIAKNLKIKSQKANFIEALYDTSRVRFAARKANVSITTLYRYRKDDDDFANQWDEAIDLIYDRVTEEAFSRAIAGSPEEANVSEAKSGNERRYSEKLLSQLLVYAHRRKEKILESKQEQEKQKSNDVVRLKDLINGVRENSGLERIE